MSRLRESSYFYLVNATFHERYNVMLFNSIIRRSSHSLNTQRCRCTAKFQRILDRLFLRNKIVEKSRRKSVASARRIDGIYFESVKFQNASIALSRNTAVFAHSNHYQRLGKHLKYKKLWRFVTKDLIDKAIRFNFDKYNDKLNSIFQIKTIWPQQSTWERACSASRGDFVFEIFVASSSFGMKISWICSCFPNSGFILNSSEWKGITTFKNSCKWLFWPRYSPLESLCEVNEIVIPFGLSDRNSFVNSVECNALHWK